MQLIFQVIRPGDVEQELTQRDQFDTDKVPLPATLMREALQNVLDARAPEHQGPLRVLIGRHEVGEADRPFWRDLFAEFPEHLQASNVPSNGIDWSNPDFLTIEDFGTTGLRGATDRRDDGEFSDFWRRVGRSHKSGNKGGSWGLGKLVFPISSRIRCFFGLTVREADSFENGHLMGQAILNTHDIGTVRYVPHGFFCEPGIDGIQITITDVPTIKRFRASTGVTRTDQPGLSIVIPFPRGELTTSALIPIIIEHYFFPILTGELVVEVAGKVITADTLEALAAEHQEAGLADGHLIAFIRELREARRAAAPVDVPLGWDGSGGFEAVFDSELVQSFRERHQRGELLHFSLPLRFSPLGEEAVLGKYEVFLRAAAAGVTAQSLFIRNAITVPNEATYFSNPHVFAAVIASEPPASSFLRDAENPAHTSWNGRAEKLVARWRSPAPILSKIRNSARKLAQLVGNAENLVDEDALLSLLSVRRQAAERQPRVRNPLTNPPVNIPDPKPQMFRIRKQSGGFSIHGAGDDAASRYPLTLTVRAAYAIARGNPFRRYQPLDFSFRAASSVQITAQGASADPVDDNTLLVIAEDSSFSVEITGFDGNRDLIVQASRSRS